MGGKMEKAVEYRGRSGWWRDGFEPGRGCGHEGVPAGAAEVVPGPGLISARRLLPILSKKWSYSFA
jgi:hypothetical protein